MGPKKPSPPGQIASGESENATQAAMSVARARPMSRSQSGRNSTAAMARAARTNGRPPPDRGSSNRSQSTAITNAAAAESATVLSMCGIRCRFAGEAGGELIAGAYDGDRDSRGLEAQQPSLGRAGCAVEARGIDEDERHPPPGECPLNEPVD